MATRAPLSEAEKDYIVMRKQQGASLAKIAREIGCSSEAARKGWRQRRDGRQTPGRGRPPTGILSTYPATVREQAVAVKRAHPHWGPANVKLELKRQLSDEPLPSDSRLAALFKAECPEAVQPRRRRMYPEQPPSGVTFPHQRWQIDGKEKVPVGECDIATVLNIREPLAALMVGSRAILTTTAKGWRKVTVQEVQDTLRLAFEEWGCPLEVQTDHEVVYVGEADIDFPSPFTLWLMGLGMAHILSRSRRPTDQPHVERNHRTLGDMTWQDQHFASVEPLQATLDDRRQRYNEELPVHASDCRGRPPLEAHPAARHSGRLFDRAREWILFDLQRVDAYLASRIWTRKISDSGNVGIGGHHYYLGRAHRHETVSVRFMQETRAFRFQLGDGTLVSELPAVALDKADLIGYMPMEAAHLSPFQLPLPLQEVRFYEIVKGTK
jgi:transposase-like protein